MLYLQFRNKTKSLLISFLISWCIFPAQAMALMIGTYNMPPFSMHEDGEDIGLVTEILRTLLQRSGIDDYTIINYPLARGLYELEAGRIDVYYPYIKEIHKAKDNLVLIGPIAKNRIALFVRHDYAGQVSLKDMNGLVLGAERGSVSDMVLEKNHIHIEKATQKISCLRMVVANRIAACAMGVLSGMYTAAINNMYDELRYTETGDYANIYVALNASLPPEIIEKIKATYEILKKENYFEEQQRNYEKKFTVFIKSMS